MTSTGFASADISVVCMGGDRRGGDGYLLQKGIESQEVEEAEP